MRDIIIRECPYCGSLFSSSTDLEIHIDRHNNGSASIYSENFIYQCPRCDELFRTKTDLVDHIDNHHRHLLKSNYTEPNSRR